MELNLYGRLREIVGQKSLEYFPAQPITLREFLVEISRQYPALRGELFTEKDELHSHFLIVVNGKNISYLPEMMEFPLDFRDKISLLPAISGGEFQE